jgi:hypothetical protein
MMISFCWSVEVSVLFMAFPGRSSSGFSAAIKKAPETLRFQAPLPVLCGACMAPDTHCLIEAGDRH